MASPKLYWLKLEVLNFYNLITNNLLTWLQKCIYLAKYQYIGKLIYYCVLEYFEAIYAMKMLNHSAEKYENVQIKC